MPSRPVIYWIRNDFRLADNPALTAAIATRKAVLPVYIWCPDEEGEWCPGGALRAWLAQTLKPLSADYKGLGSRLIIESGDAEDVLTGLCRELSVTSVFAAHRYEPAARQQETHVRYSLSHVGADLHLFAAGVLNPPASIETTNGDPYQVFTPYYKRCMNEPPPAAPLPAPDSIPAPETWPDSLEIDDLALVPEHPWVEKVLSHWSIGEEGAHAALDAFLEDGAARYTAERDIPAEASTSSLSPRLHFGELSPRQVWHAVQERAGSDTRNEKSYEGFIRQLYWREFAHHLLFHFPTPLKRR